MGAERYLCLMQTQDDDTVIVDLVILHSAAIYLHVFSHPVAIDIAN